MNKKLLFILSIVILCAASLAGCIFPLGGNTQTKPYKKEQLGKVEGVTYDAETQIISWQPVENAKNYSVHVTCKPTFDVYDGYRKLKFDSSNEEHGWECPDYYRSEVDTKHHFESYFPYTAGFKYTFEVHAAYYDMETEDTRYSFDEGEADSCDYVLTNDISTTDSLVQDVLTLINNRIYVDVLTPKDLFGGTRQERILSVEQELTEDKGLALRIKMMTSNYDKFSSHKVILMSFFYSDATILSEVRNRLGSYTAYEVSFPFNYNYAENPQYRYTTTYEKLWEQICDYRYYNSTFKTEYLETVQPLTDTNAQLVYGYSAVRETSRIWSAYFYFRGIDENSNTVWYQLDVSTRISANERVKEGVTLTQFTAEQTAFMEEYFAMREAKAAESNQQSATMSVSGELVSNLSH